MLLTSYPGLIAITTSTSKESLALVHFDETALKLKLTGSNALCGQRIYSPDNKLIILGFLLLLSFLGAKLTPYGSSFNEFGNANSDVDICMTVDGVENVEVSI